MIERLNFYDIYGFLVPGLSALGLAWLPLGLFSGGHLSPGSEVISTLGALVAGYVTGHLLQNMARVVFPSKLRERGGRQPSDALLDANDSGFSAQFKARLTEKIKGSFRIDVERLSNEPLAETSSRRSEAFMLCRAVLIKERMAAYFEQQHGMYSLLRGLSSAFGLAAPYYAGLAFSRWAIYVPEWVMLAMFLAVLASAILSFWRKWRVRFLVAGLAGALASGFWLGSWFPPRVEAMQLLLAMACVSLGIGIVFNQGFKYFAHSFASTIYRDFMSLGRIAEPESRTTPE